MVMPSSCWSKGNCLKTLGFGPEFECPSLSDLVFAGPIRLDAQNAVGQFCFDHVDKFKVRVPEPVFLPCERRINVDLVGSKFLLVESKPAVVPLDPSIKIDGVGLSGFVDLDDVHMRNINTE